MKKIERQKRRLYLHAGTHKTGSTSIQTLLLDMKSQIEAQGKMLILDYPDNNKLPANCMLIANAFIRKELWTPARINKYNADFKSPQILAWLESQCNQSDCQDLIISSESFCYLRTEEELAYLLGVLVQLDLEVVPIVFLRNEKEWRYARKIQLEKNASVMNFMKFRKDDFSLLDDWYFDRFQIINFWQQLSSHCIFIDYDSEMRLGKSVLPVFLESVKLDLTYDVNHYYLNKTRRRNFISVCSWITKYLR